MTGISTKENTLVLRRSVDAAPERVFDMWTQPERIRTWMCPPECAIESLETDVREGGSYRIAMRQPNGEVWNVRGSYREVRRPER
ncbi:MAG TPA: SRPBCC domain-containing protein, partial [Candidatus Acidoferrum sp.]|nr:SRPBCC domain-containing protein [Candidatus Acidoferrum sp.]